MLQGNGTFESPLISTRLKLMDLSLKEAIQDGELKAVMIVEHDDVLYAFAFELEDFKEIIDRGAMLLEAL